MIRFNTDLSNIFNELNRKAIKGNLSDEDIFELKEIVLILKDFNEITIGDSIVNLSSKEIKNRLEEAEMNVIEPYFEKKFRELQRNN